MVRGWSFDSDSREGAVLKGWVESRFGLMPRYHGQPRDPAGDGLPALPGNALAGPLRHQRTRGAIRPALHLLPGRTGRPASPWRAACHALSRGQPAWPTTRCWIKGEGGQSVVLLNNLNSFTCSRDRACEFGDYILEVANIPLTKIFFQCGLLPGVLQGEDEFLVIGGVVEVTLSTL